MNDEYPKSLRDANYDLAGELIDRARTMAAQEGRFHAKAARSLKSYRSTNQSVIAGGGPRYPYFFAAEFGQDRRSGWYARRQYQGQGRDQLKSWRGNQWGGWEGGPGYFLHPTIRRDAKQLIDAYMERIDALTAQAFPQ
ncbi:hypothetical protein O7635_29575 [Asanoa sp. WMMD1127]|uniref:hypothetical protein n=1 Tax=Asanoa sp. WMMD1127 TaxID=3016107 RepID=UPI00241699AC|nr:hypothetical protein [Asanoa sp. WMMD1127]MDG4826020.1 hypothetical protein [Asanoa sp. WMMD1127]